MLNSGPGNSTAEVPRMMRDSYPDIKVIVMTDSEDDECIIGALKNGASGCIPKDSTKAQFIEAVNIAVSGGTLIPPKIATEVMRDLAEMGRKSEDTEIDEKAAAQFNDSELKIIRAVGQGLSNKEIASSLFLSEGTIRNYISGILLKLKLRDKTQLAIWAVRKGMNI
ncbi:MAG: response regulator transcription factor, partial [Solobacterium sp.]|nr:response regulator transcription factor [Solobacterium sp.]